MLNYQMLYPYFEATVLPWPKLRPKGREHTDDCHEGCSKGMRKQARTKNSWLVGWNDGTWIGATIQNELISGL